MTKGLNPQVKMKDSGVEWLGEVPEHWDVMHLRYACSLIKDGTHLPPPRVSDGVRLLSVRNLDDDVFFLREDDSMISYEHYMELCQSFVPKPNDIALAIVGATLGKTAIIPDGIGDFHIQRSVAIFRPSDEVLSDWLYFVFRSNLFQKLLWQYAGFSAQPGIYLGALSNFRVAIPPIDEQAEIINSLKVKVAELELLFAEAQKAINLLQERRSALISAAVTGKTDVRGLA